MSRKPETRRQQKVQEALKLAFPGCWLFKVHGDEFMRSGLPDIVGCVQGLFFGLEIKNPGEEPSELQRHELTQIKKAGGISAVVFEPEDAVELVRAAVARAKARR